MYFSHRGAFNLIGFILVFGAFFWLVGYATTRPAPTSAAAAVADGIVAFFGFLFQVLGHVLHRL